MSRYLFLSLLLFGCYDQHGRGRDAGRDADPDAPGVQICECCGVGVEWPADLDCAFGACDFVCFPIDTGLPDAGPDTGPVDCSPMALHALCDYRVVPVGVPSRITGLLGDGERCFCGETLGCSASIRRPGVLDLSTALCTGDIACEACFPHVEGECEIPALTEGEWQVYVNGEFSFQVTAEVPDPEPSPDRCQRAANPDDCRPDMPGAAVPSSFCHSSSPSPGRAEIRVFHECPPCAAPAGPCEVEVLGDRIHVRPSSLLASCEIVCPPVCVPREDVCLTPRLEPGLYRMSFEGAAFTSVLSVGSDEHVEVCGGGPIDG